jgi:hypothetical protein
MLAVGHASSADLPKFRRIEPQFIAALGDPAATSGNGAQSWGFWNQDPGPRACRLDHYPQLKATGVAPAQWKFDASDWWLEEHGLIMEKPTFPLPAGKYLVTGDRDVTTVLTVHPKDRMGFWGNNRLFAFQQRQASAVGEIRKIPAGRLPSRPGRNAIPSTRTNTVFRQGPASPGAGLGFRKMRKQG